MNSFELFCEVLLELLLRSLLFSRIFYLSFASSFIALSRDDLFILSLLCHFVNPFFRFLLFLHFIFLFLSLFVHFASLLCSFDTKSDSWATLSCHFGLFIIFRKKINSQNRSSVSHWRRHPDLNWGIRVLQTLALPLGYVTILKKTPHLQRLFLLERTTRLELATSTLARWRSTRWAKSALSGIYNIICKIPKPDI